MLPVAPVGPVLPVIPVGPVGPYNPPYCKEFQPVKPSPILKSPVSVSYPISPTAKIGFTGGHSVDKPCRSCKTIFAPLYAPEGPVFPVIPGPPQLNAGPSK